LSDFGDLGCGKAEGRGQKAEGKKRQKVEDKYVTIIILQTSELRSL
jgi:hypothetical protein